MSIALTPEHRLEHASPTADLRGRRAAELTALLARPDARAALARHGTPLLLLDPERVRAQYRRLRAALPDVHLHYAVKALSHASVLDAIADEGGCFDVATLAELDALRARGIEASRAIHTHPIKSPREIIGAITAGVRTFVVDNEVELAKFRGAPDDVRVLVRLSYRSPDAHSDLSSKFGVGPFEAGHLVERAMSQGTTVTGFSFHVGSQLDRPSRFAEAVADTLTLMDHLEDTLGARFDTLDIGGGFAVDYDREVAPVEEIAALLRPLLAPLAGRVRVIAEPGRYLVAEAMTLVTSVIGIAERPDGRWYYLDDGIYGSYSNVPCEGVHPLLYTGTEVMPAAGAPALTRMRRATLAGPTCDSTDVVAREVLMPVLDVGDLVVSPAMGAYTAVTATRFNGREPATIAVLGG